MFEVFGGKEPVVVLHERPRIPDHDVAAPARDKIHTAIDVELRKMERDVRRDEMFEIGGVAEKELETPSAPGQGSRTVEFTGTEL